MPVGRRAKPEALFTIGQPVTVIHESQPVNAIVRKFKDDGRIRVQLDDSHYLAVGKSQIMPRLCATEGCTRPPRQGCAFCDICMGLNPEETAKKDEAPDEDPEKKGGREMGFVEYEIKWQARKGKKKPKYFTCDVPDHGLHFYGWWRKSRVANNDQIVYAIDLFAKRNGHDYTIEPIYYEESPLRNYNSLNADICAAMNKFLHQTINGSAETLDTLQAKSRFPVLKIKRLRTIDSLIIKLKEIRDTSIRAGGQRLVELKGDQEGSPTVRIIVDLTTQALVMKGKVPDLEHGAVFDAAMKGNKHARGLKLRPDSTNVEALVAELKKAKAEGNVPLARKIRATLRKMGFRGGARAFDKTKGK